MSAFTADVSAGEFTRGMDLLARAPNDSGASSRAAAVQDDYLMKLLSSARPSSAMRKVHVAAKQVAAATTSAAVDHYSHDGMAAQPDAVVEPTQSAPAGPKQRGPLQATAGAARAALGPQRFAGLRARLLQHQDVFLQQMFDLHRCVRRQQQLVAVCDQPEAVAAALNAVLAPSEPGSQEVGLSSQPVNAPVGAAPNAPAAPPAQLAALQRAAAPAALHHAFVAQPLPGSYPYGSVAARFGGPGITYAGPQMPQAVPPAYDPMAAWYAHHYGTPPAPFVAAASPLVSHHRPAGSLPVMGTFSNGGSVYSPAGALYGQVAASRNPALPRCSASAGVPPGAAAFNGRTLALSHGDRWWQDPAQVRAHLLFPLAWS